MDGFINLSKLRGMTSSDAVVAVRRVLPRGTKVGHGGTLDPDAAGVLPICVGRAARLFDYIIDKQKTYIAELTLGVVTDTQDSSGAVLSRAPVSASESDVRRAALSFVGDIAQIPPAYSAIQVSGKRMYDLARAGQAPDLRPRRVRVDSIVYVRQTATDKHMLRILCGKGVYIRTICHDIGALLGCGGHMSMLTRTAAGIFTIEHSVTLEELRAVAADNEIQSLLYPLDAPLEHLPAIRLDNRHAFAVRNGNPVALPDCALPGGTIARVYVNEEFAGIGEYSCGWVLFKAMLGLGTEAGA